MLKYKILNPLNCLKNLIFMFLKKGFLSSLNTYFTATQISRQINPLKVIVSYTHHSPQRAPYTLKGPIHPKLNCAV